MRILGRLTGVHHQGGSGVQQDRVPDRTLFTSKHSAYYLRIELSVTATEQLRGHQLQAEFARVDPRLADRPLMHQPDRRRRRRREFIESVVPAEDPSINTARGEDRSEERRVGKECCR